MRFLLSLCLATLATTASAFVSPSDPKRSLTPAVKAEYDQGRNKVGGGPVRKPPILDGTFAGDYGFDPLGFVQTRDDLIWYREAEMKHARLVSQLLWDRRG